MSVYSKIALVPLLFCLSCAPKSVKETTGTAMIKGDESDSWLEQAKFGMFIHWGLYSVPAGNWKGAEVPWYAEWLQRTKRIPIDDYSQIAKEFDPKGFDAEEWVALAKRAGMKYIIITAKHHDGFAMYDSNISTYDIADASPFGRDPLAELAAECQKEGIKLCFYYSNEQDWHEPGARGNFWDFKPPTAMQFQQYLDEKVKPQVKELLTEYGPIGIIWFDTPKIITAEQSEQLYDLVHATQKNTLVNGRVGNGYGDYICYGDNDLPAAVIEQPWETIGTMNDTWGYSTHDSNWKSTKQLLQLLTQIVSKGGNYVLNIGPTGEGTIPDDYKKRLREIGSWLKVNGEAIYGAGTTPLGSEKSWGTITTQPGKLYVHIYDWPKEKLIIPGLSTTIKKAYLLDDKSIAVPAKIIRNMGENIPGLELGLPMEAPDPYVSVVVLEIGEEPAVVDEIVPDQDGSILLESFMATAKDPAMNGELETHEGGVIADWNRTSLTLDWDFTVLEPGTYDIVLVGSSSYWFGWDPGHTVSANFGDTILTKRTTDDGRRNNLRSWVAPDVLTALGQVTFKTSGTKNLSFSVEKFPVGNKVPFRFRSIQLIPIDQNFWKSKPGFTEPTKTVLEQMKNAGIEF